MGRDLLTLCANNGVVINKSIFQFCCDSFDFAGLTISNKGVEPSLQMLASIQNYPPPKDIHEARAFFGLVNQVQWSYANASEMAPFRDLVKPHTKFYWDPQLAALFQKAKDKIISQVRAGVRTYDIHRRTCLQTDWSKEGMGYLLLQQYCNCTLEKAPDCCPTGWQLVFAGSRFTKEAEARYAPTEGEALAVAWALEHSCTFTLGCTKLFVSTDHRPLLGIFNDRHLDDIKNPRIVRLKEKTLQFTFTIQYNPGKWHRGPDALSRSPHHTNPALIASVLPLCMSPTSDSYSLSLDDDMPAIPASSIASLNSSYFFSPDVSIITIPHVQRATSDDQSLQRLMSTIHSGFPSTRQQLDPDIRDFWSVKDNLWTTNAIIMFKDRIVIPQSIRKHVLASLHGAHQGVKGMTDRASISVYWPHITADIRNTRYNCHRCNEISPSQPREPLVLTVQPSYPFQHVCMDFFSIQGHHYLSLVDRFSGWPTIVHYGKQTPTTDALLKRCRTTFSTFGVQKSFHLMVDPSFHLTSFSNL